MSIAQFFIPQLRRQVAKKFNVQDDKTIESIMFMVNKSTKVISLQCHCDEGIFETQISEDEISMASDSVERAIKKHINGELIAYQLTIDVKKKIFNAILYCKDNKGEKIAIPINNIF